LHSLQAFFGDPDLCFDFVFYIETVMIYGITDAFEIEILDWLVLFASCMLVTEDWDSIGLPGYSVKIERLSNGSLTALQRLSNCSLTAI
jgi:hypothetical protein